MWDEKKAIVMKAIAIMLLCLGVLPGQQSSTVCHEKEVAPVKHGEYLVETCARQVPSAGYHAILAINANGGQSTTILASSLFNSGPKIMIAGKQTLHTSNTVNPQEAANPNCVLERIVSGCLTS